jgi:hypothetical protein
VTRQHGQALIETAIMLPLVLLASLLMLQLLWLSWVQYNLATASSYVLRTAALQSLNADAMRSTLASAMAAVQPQLDSNADSHDSNYPQLLRAVAASQLRSYWAAHIEVLQPSAEQLRDEGGVVAVDHNALRYRASADRTRYVAARTIELEIWWCMPLQVPWAAEAMAALRRALANPVQRFCQQRQVWSDAPLWGLRYRLQGPLLSNYHGPD